MEMNSIKYLKRIAYLLESGACYARSYHMMCDEFLPSSDLTPEEIAQAMAEEEEQQDDFNNHQEWLENFISDFEQFLNEEEGICDCEGPYYNHEHECHIPPNLCVYHNSRLANRERAYQDWVKYLDAQGIKLDNEEEE